MTAPRLVPIKRRDPITARWLNRLVTAVTDLQQPANVAAAGGTTVTLHDPETSNLSPGQILDPDAVAQSNGGVVTHASAAIGYTEVSRVVSVVRVENPDDPSQFVDVEVVDSITFVNAAGARLALTFNNQ